MNQVTLCIPGTLREFTAGAAALTIRASTVGEALIAAGEAHRGLLSRLMTPEGRLRANVNVFVDEDSIKALNGLDTHVPDGAVLIIVPAVAGG